MSTENRNGLILSLLVTTAMFVVIGVPILLNEGGLVTPHGNQPSESLTGRVMPNRHRVYYDQGVQAFRAGVSAEANPYRTGAGIGPGNQEASLWWLQGYVDAKLAQKE